MTTTVHHIALTGHRPTKLGGYNIDTPAYKQLQSDLEMIIENRLKQFDVVWGHSGLALGADTIWSKAILAMREKHPGRVFFHAEIPNMNQSSIWFKKSDLDFWKHEVETADDSTDYDPNYMTWLKTKPTEYQIKARVRTDLLNRNLGMIDHADEMVAVYNGIIGPYDPHTGPQPGGTAHAVYHSQKLNKPIVQVNPDIYFKKG